MMAVSLASVPLLVKNDFVKIAGGDGGDFLSEGDLGLGEEDGGDVLEFIELGMFDFGVDLVVTVADADGEDAAEEIEVLGCHRHPRRIGLWRVRRRAGL
jgi:hypothetical protein